MKRLDTSQINSKTYWNYIYTTPAKNKEYWIRTFRFFTAVNFVKNGDTFMDLGCGVGIPSRMVMEEKEGCEAWGVDISDEIINNNKKDAPNITWKQGVIGNLKDIPSDYFDVVFCGETIEHLDFPEDAFKDAYRLLKTCGKFIVTTPLENRLISQEHIWEFTKEDIEKFYKDAGFVKSTFIDLPNMEYLHVIFGIGVK